MNDSNTNGFKEGTPGIQNSEITLNGFAVTSALDTLKYTSNVTMG